MRRTLLAVVAAVATLTPMLVTTSAASAASQPRVVRWIDGDTVLTNRGTIRLIGIDTPERGKCGFDAATRVASRLAPPGSFIRVTNPKRVKDKDAYGRLLRYVNRGKTDLGAAQIKYGAWARYDSRDGYQKHPRQAKYRKLDARQRNYCGYTPAAAPKPKSKPKSKSNGATASGSVAPKGKSCPSHAPIKGNESSMIYHLPGQRYYAATNPEECFRTAAAAKAAGYRPAKI